MSMLEYLEKDKESVINGLENVQTPEKAQALIKAELDRLLLQYNQKCELPACREAAASMLQTAQLSSGLVDTLGEVKVWEEVQPSVPAASAVPNRSLKEKAFLMAAALCAATALLLAILSDPDSFRAANLLLAIILGVASPAFAYLAGKSEEKRKLSDSANDRSSLGSRMGRKTGAAKMQAPLRRTEPRVDAQKIYTCLHNTIFAVDQNLNRLSALSIRGDKGNMISHSGTAVFGNAAEIIADRKSERTAEMAADPAIELFADLLEAEYSRDGEYALDKIGQVKFFLHQKEIETVDYDGNNEELFEFMPAAGQRTFRPALVREGVLLRKGLAAGER